jgi:hypothetical protein
MGLPMHSGKGEIINAGAKITFKVCILVMPEEINSMLIAQLLLMPDETPETI